MYITKSKGPGIDLWETPFYCSQSEKIAVPTSNPQLKLYAINSNKTPNKIKKSIKLSDTYYSHK